MTEITRLDYKGFEIRQDPTTGFVCLTDMWKATGSDPKKQPHFWLRQENILELLVALMNSNSAPDAELKLRPPYITDKVLKFAEQREVIKTSTGRYGGTYAIPKLAIAYAKYLSTAFHLHVLDVLERIGNRDVTFTAELINRHTPQDQEWLEKRLAGKQTERNLKNTILEHGSNGGHIFSWFPRINTFAITGLEPKDIKKRLKVKSTRDGLTAEELTHLASLEYLQARGIRKYQAQGDEEIKGVMADAAERFASLLNDYSLPEERPRPTLLGKFRDVMVRLLNRSRHESQP
jgi:hypothetical protein